MFVKFYIWCLCIQFVCDSGIFRQKLLTNGLRIQYSTFGLCQLVFSKALLADSWSFDIEIHSNVESENHMIGLFLFSFLLSAVSLRWDGKTCTNKSIWHYRKRLANRWITLLRCDLLRILSEWGGTGFSYTFIYTFGTFEMQTHLLWTLNYYYYLNDQLCS